MTAGTAAARSAVARALALAASLLAALGPAASALAGPVEVYRTGPKFCPHDRPADAAPMTETVAIARARSLLPADFCAPSRFVSGCEAIPEFALGSWRIYVHQYHLTAGSRDYGGLAHSYVVLDPVGNCYANIPGTEFGAPR